jgi:lipid II:glycine glycyltransferase (peptidoglycan interpeptide bridge formation enzyme)
MMPKGLMRLLLAEHHKAAGSRIIGGCIFFTFGRTATYAFGASQTSDLRLMPNDIILWQAINDARRDGFQVFDFGEVPEGNEGLARFKSKWGAEPVRLHRYYYPDFPEAELSSEHNESLLAAMANAVWRRLPLGVTSWLGDRVFARL